MSETKQAETQELTKEMLAALKASLCLHADNDPVDIDVWTLSRLITAAEREMDYLGKMTKMNSDLRETIKQADLKAQEENKQFRAVLEQIAEQRLLVMDDQGETPYMAAVKLARAALRPTNAALSPAQPQATISTEQTAGADTAPLQPKGETKL